MTHNFSRLANRSILLTGCLLLLITLTACQPIVDNRSAEQKAFAAAIDEAFAAGSLMEINGTQIFVKVMGEGEPIIMLHGGPGAEHIFFARYTQELAADHQLIYYDQRSTGFSVPDIAPEHLTVDTFIEDLEGIRQALGLDKVSLLGWSWGGDLAMLYAMKYPEHLKGIILVDPGNVDPKFDEVYNQNFSQKGTPEEFAALDAAYQRLSTEKSGEAYVAFAQIFLSLYMADKSKAKGLEILIPDNSARYGDAVGAGLWEDTQKNDSFKGIGEITTPTLIIHGDKDPIPLESSQQINKTIASSQLVVFENVGHIPFVEAPELFYATVREFMQQITK